jgi:acyl-CoA synthetase (AMP-forming)/AMP-acid ligase II
LRRIANPLFSEIIKMSQSLEQLSATPIKPSTLVELLRWRADQQPDGHAYTFLIDGKRESAPLTYAVLDRQARAIAALLQQYQAQGERALLLYPQGLEVIAAFCGCLYAGVIAIPVPPPESGRLKRTLPRLRAIVQDAQASFTLTTGSILSLVENVQDEFPEFEKMHWLDTEQVDLALAEQWQDPHVDKAMLAYLQYTSGSTSTPKGVMLSHYNLMHHSRYLQQACGYEPGSITTTWMPYFHDYGLVEGMIVPLYNGTPCYLMSPFAFIKRPVQWLRNITQYRITHSQAPNFAYDLCVRKVKPKEIVELDLSSWQAAGNAAEPINPKVMASFVEIFSSCGFSWNAFAPAYGLAEYTLLVSTKPKGEKPVIAALDAASLEQDKIVDAKLEQQDGVRFIAGCGRRVCETNIAIVHPDTLTRCAPDEVGEIWVSDPSVAQGYWQREEETTQTFRAYISETGEGPFLRTGDLGFLKEGELFINGRIKDLIIIRGTNHYPQDIEWTVQHLHPALRPDYGAVFSIEDDGEEQLVVVQEVERRTENLDTEQLIGDIRQEIAEQHELQVYAVVLAKSGTILKTASGKIQRRACRQNFLAGTINVVGIWSENPERIAKFTTAAQLPA